jgi:hypothetical protein
MASYHLTARIGTKGKAGSHGEYISRDGKYKGRERYEDLEATGAGNMPKWAEQNPAHFWKAADEHERANGSSYREFEIALPRELTPDQRRELVAEFVAQEIDDRHAYQWAIHTPKAALEGDKQPHAHIMYNERKLDGIERDPAQYFKRYNAKRPELGGCQKVSGGKTAAALKEGLLAERQRWADLQNKHLERYGHSARVDHRSLEAQGIGRDPERHLGGIRVRQLDDQGREILLERRASGKEFEQAVVQVETREYIYKTAHLARMAKTWATKTPEEAVNLYSELAVAVELIGEMDKKLQMEGATPAQRARVADDTREKIAKNIEQGNVPGKEARQAIASWKKEAEVREKAKEEKAQRVEREAEENYEKAAAKLYARPIKEGEKITGEVVDIAKVEGKNYNVVEDRYGDRYAVSVGDSPWERGQKVTAKRTGNVIEIAIKGREHSR